MSLKLYLTERPRASDLEILADEMLKAEPLFVLRAHAVGWHLVIKDLRDEWWWYREITRTNKSTLKTLRRFKGVLLYLRARQLRARENSARAIGGFSKS